MEIINLRGYVDHQLFYFIEKFKEHGWKQEDVHYVTKKVDFQELERKTREFIGTDPNKLSEDNNEYQNNYSDPRYFI